MKGLLTGYFVSFILLVIVLGGVVCNPDAKRLYDDLLSNYNRLIRPVSNNTDTVLVKLGLRLSQLIELNLKDQILTTNVWLEHEWNDGKFKWEPPEYGGMTELYVPSEHIWIPDIVLYNNADGEYVVTTMTKAVLHYTGKVFWTPPAIFKSSCEIDVRYFPYDQQTCFMKFGSWSYGGDQIDLQHIRQEIGTSMVQEGIDLREFYPSVEWDIMSVPAEAHKKYYPCCPEPFPDIYFNITLRRRTLFYTVNLIVPCVGISYLSVLVFYLPADSGEKIVLCITILLSQTMFFLLVSEIMPSTSLALPLLGKYLLFTMLLIGLCVIVTILILNVHYRKPSTHKMSPWIRQLFIKKLPKLLLMRVPQQLLVDTHFKKGQMKPNTAISSSSPTSSSPDSTTRYQRDSLNGINSFLRNNCDKSIITSFFPAIVNNSYLNRMKGLYPSMLSHDINNDLVVYKKYPFQLEKAIHNVKFIQHHLQRQDEFTAEDLDWGFVAMVMDRLFLWIFALASFIGTAVILCEAPSFCDDTTDANYSSISNQRYIPSFE